MRYTGTDGREGTSSGARAAIALRAATMIAAGAAAPRPRIVLNMIVKNEAAIIERALESAAPFVDAWIIADTGSTDDTRARIAAFFEARGIPGELHEFPFENFSQARNRALDLARSASPRCDYALLMDADMELRIADRDVRTRVTGPAYSIRQVGGATYWVPRLVRLDRPFTYRGATHEYLDTGERPPRLEGLHFIDHACGSSRADKHERDRRLLERALEDDPNDARAMFYLAQTLRESGDFAAAAEWYERRVAAAGWEEEAWYAAWMLSECHRERGDVARFMEQALRAYQRRPTRAEPLHRLARHYRLAGEPDVALVFAEAGTKVAYPRDEALFVEDYVYEDGFREELSIAGYYARDPARVERGAAACEDLATCRHARDTVVYTARRNLRFYARPLEAHVPGVTYTQLDVAAEPGFALMNPSVHIDRGDVRCVLRTVNYQVDDDGNYHFDTPDEQARTRNFLARLDANWTATDVRAICDLATGPPVHEHRVRGYEDLRLVSWRGEWFCLATARDRSPEGLYTTVLLRLDANGDIVESILQPRLEPTHEKNWLPFIDGEALCALYRTDPTTIVRCDDPREPMRVVARSDPPLRLEHLRGGSQLVAIDGGWIYLTHEIAVRPPKARIYLHRFVLLDASFRVIAVSRAFRFLREGIEFCAGLARDPAQGRLVASFGVADRSAWIASMPESEVLAFVRAGIG